MGKKGAKSNSKKLSNQEIQLALIENFVGVQRVLTNLSVKFDNLSDHISRLLHLFEVSAQSFLRKQEEGQGDNKDLLTKLDTLLDQNKTIAKGLSLIEEKIKHKVYGGEASANEERLSGFGTARPQPRLIPRA